MSDRLDLFAPAVRFGQGAVGSAGDEAAALGWARVLLVTDVDVLGAGIPGAVADALARRDVWSETVAAPAGEPRDVAVAELAAATAAGVFDGIVAVGGGAVLDTAKLVALERAGGSLRDHVNPPFGGGLPPPDGLLGIVAVPTTAGSGSDVSGVAVVDLVEEGVKTAVSHPALRPRVAIADPETTRSAPPAATAAAGLDVLAHALESMTARAGRAPSGAVYGGRNAYSDALCGEALPLLFRALPAAVGDGADLAARTDAMLAATLANLGAAVAGAHAGHAIAYAVASAGGDGPRRVPHGVAVALALPGLLDEIERADPQRHALLAERLGGAPRAQVERLLEATGARRLPAYGFGAGEAGALAAHALTQRRLIANAPSWLDGAAVHRIVAAMLA